jgi:hypothetical protein
MLFSQVQKMGKKVISLFLFTLFCIVMAFPGYGRASNALLKSTSAQICASQDHPLTLEGLMKKCLACGITVVEEERPVEENQPETEDGLSNAFEDFMMLPSPISVLAFHKYNHVISHVVDYMTIHLRAIPTPPPEY